MQIYSNKCSLVNPQMPPFFFFFRFTFTLQKRDLGKPRDNMAAVLDFIKSQKYVKDSGSVATQKRFLCPPSRPALVRGHHSSVRLVLTSMQLGLTVHKMDVVSVI